MEQSSFIIVDYHTFYSAIWLGLYMYLMHAYLPLHEILTHSTHTDQIRHETPADILLALHRQQ